MLLRRPLATTARRASGLVHATRRRAVSTAASEFSIVGQNREIYLDSQARSPTRAVHTHSPGDRTGGQNNVLLLHLLQLLAFRCCLR